MRSSLAFIFPTSVRKGRVLRSASLTITVAVALLLCAASVAAGASGAQAFQNGGTNVGNALMAWGKALLFAMAAIMGIGALIKRSVGEGVTILIIVLILGAFLYDQADTENIIRNLWGAVGG
jgi:hypothetical protein